MAGKSKKVNSSRKPPSPSDSHAEVDEWIARVMPDLNPVVKRVDEMIREAIPDVQYAIKWRRAHYGLPDVGWIIEMVAYDVSVNVVFFGGADFESPPPLGDTGRSRYIKVRTVEEVEESAMQQWIEAARGVPGWQ